MITFWAAVLGVVSEGLPTGRRDIDPLTEHEYTVQIEADGEHRILLTHAGADIALTIRASDPAETLNADIPNRHLGEEYAVVRGGADYSVTIVNRGGDRGDWYELEVVPVPEAELVAARLSSVATSFTGDTEAKEELLTSALAAWAEREVPIEESRLAYALGSHYRSSNRLEEAAKSFQLAAEMERDAGLQRRSLWSRYAAAEMLIWRDELVPGRDAFDGIARDALEVGDTELIGASRNYAALSYLVQGDLQQARALYLELADFLAAHDLLHQLATVYHNLGGTHFESGEPLDALDYFQRAMALDQQANPGASVAETLEEIGGLYALMGRCDVAFRHLNHALQELRADVARSEAASTKRAEGRIVNRIGNCHRDLGDLSLALEFYTRALALRTEASDERGVAYTLENIGEVYREQGLPELALEMHRRSLSSHTERGDTIGQASSLVAVGNDELALRDFSAALATGERAIALATEHGYRGSEGRAYRLVGDALRGLGRVTEADARYAVALDKFRASRSHIDELELLAARAELYQTSGRVDRGKEVLEQALAHAEELRAGIGSSNLRLRFVATLQDLYMMHLDVLLGDSPSEADVLAGLLINDTRRARVLREELALGLAAASGSLEEDSALRYETLRANLTAKQSKLQDIAENGSPDDAARLADEVNRLRLELLAMDAEVAASNRHWSSVVQQPDLSVATVQSRLTPDAVVVDLALSKRATHVWFITDSEVLYKQQDAVDVTQGGDALDRVLSLLFTDLAAEFPERSSLTVIPDGAVSLHQLAALRLEERDDYLVDRFDLTLTPSIALVDTTEAVGERLDSLTLVGEPVFAAHQARAPETDALTHTLRSFDIDALAPLPYSGVEIDAVRELAQGREVLVLRGFGASKANVMSGALAGSDIVHFATHGFVNAKAPELSGIVLSLVDANEDPVDGFISVNDIFGLRSVDASMVVLSGCRTALGERIRGEGSMSLARAFMQVGVRHTIASQWDVPDRSTAELMIAFYEGLLQRGLSPASALASAQRRIKRNPRWEDPFYWAGFTLWSASAP